MSRPDYEITLNPSGAYDVIIGGTAKANSVPLAVAAEIVDAARGNKSDNYKGECNANN